MKFHYLELESENYALTTGVKYGPCPIGPGWGGGGKDFDDSVITPATARGFENSFFLGHLWDVLLWLRSSRVPVSHRQVARGCGAEGPFARERTGTSKGLTTPLVLRLPMAESCAFFAQTLPCGLS